MNDNHDIEERIAIMMDSGISESDAIRIAGGLNEVQQRLAKFLERKKIDDAERKFKRSGRFNY